jgi:hypothetical protein
VLGGIEMRQCMAFSVSATVLGTSTSKSTTSETKPGI